MAVTGHGFEPLFQADENLKTKYKKEAYSEERLNQDYIELWISTWLLRNRKSSLHWVEDPELSPFESYLGKALGVVGI